MLPALAKESKGDEKNTVPDETAYALPIWLFGNPAAKKRIVFVWGKNCKKCISTYKDTITPLYQRHLSEEHPDILITFIQSDSTKTIMDYVCYGHEIYTSLVVATLSGKNNFYDEIINNKNYHHEENCKNRSHTRDTINYFEKTIDKQFGSANLPAILLDGRRISDFSELDKL